MRSARQSDGFTLVEIIVMILILGLLMAVALPNFAGAQDRSRNAGVQNNLHILQQALEEYGSENNHVYQLKLSNGFVGAGNNFLPGDAYPETPWGTHQAANKDLVFDDAKAGQVYLLEDGKIMNPEATNHFGAIAWGVGVDGKAVIPSQQYCIAGTGKKEKHPMRVLSLRNY